MVARLLRLRLTLLGAAFHGRFAEAGRRVGLGLFAILAAIGLAGVPALVAADATLGSGTAQAGALDVVLGALIVAAGVIVPFFANRRHLEPRQFGFVPTRASGVATALLTSTILSWPALWLLVWLLALSVMRVRQGVAWSAVLIAAVLILIFAIVGARVTSALSKLLISRRSVGALRAVGLLMLIAALPVIVFAIAESLRTPGSTMTADAAAVLGWTPFGAPLAGVQLLAVGDAPGALIRFAVTALAIVLLVVLWYPLVRASLERVERPVDTAVARDGLGWFERFPARPASVIGARVLSYWTRDPRFRIAFVAIPLAPIVMIVALMVAGVGLEALALVPVPVILLLLGWSLHNDVASDSTAIWMHVASGTRGRDDRRGRLIPVMLIGLPLVLIGSSVSVTIAGDWRVLPAVLGMNLGVLFAACAAASVFSVLMPYPTTRPGDSPFAQPSVSGSGAGLAQTLSMLVAIVLAVPVVWVAIAAISDVSFGLNLFALIFGTGYGLLVLLGGVLVGGYFFDRSAPELVALTQTFD